MRCRDLYRARWCGEVSPHDREHDFGSTGTEVQFAALGHNHLVPHPEHDRVPLNALPTQQLHHRWQHQEQRCGHEIPILDIIVQHIAALLDERAERSHDFFTDLRSTLINSLFEAGTATDAPHLVEKPHSALPRSSRSRMQSYSTHMNGSGMNLLPSGHSDNLRVSVSSVCRGHAVLSPRIARSTKSTLAGRSPSRRMKYGNHSFPNGT